MANEEATTETPETESAPPERVAVEPEHVAQETRPRDEMMETIKALDERVSQLADTVKSLLPDNRDESPVKRPWTSRRFF